MASAQQGQPRTITPEEIELLSFLRQNIVRQLCQEATRQGRPRTDPRVIEAVARHFNLGLTPHQVFNSVVQGIANSF